MTMADCSFATGASSRAGALVTSDVQILTRRSSIGAAAFSCLDSLTRTSIIHSLRIIGRLGRTLLDWLEDVALPEESRMVDEQYASEGARRFVAALAAHGTTTALVFGAHFAAATASLFDAADRHADCG